MNHCLIPRPQQVTPMDGAFLFGRDCRISAKGHTALEMADLLAGYLCTATGKLFPTQLAAGSADASGIILHQTGQDIPDAAGFIEESYRLDVTPSLVRLTAATSHGLAMGIQTLRQLLPPVLLSDAPQEFIWQIPCVVIEDAPRFRWRGMMLDVARHFFSVEEVCRFIDLIALHRFNRVHLHLTDDQGWRVEIRRYPRLTEVGSVRPGTLIGHEGARPRRYDDTPYGGHYTQDDIRLIVEFARRRRIELVPEIDMPGHMQAVIAAYPELGNTDMTLRPRCHWGISKHILNVEESTVMFMQNVLDEIMELFPGRYVHIGGDEALKDEWQESRRIQERMNELGLTGEAELQSWFINRMGRFISSRNRVMIGWDEILEGGALPPEAVVMSWRGEKGGIEAAREGHNVVMAPGSHVYFDHYQAEPIAEEPLAIHGLSTVGHVYSYEPVPAALPADKRHHVLGSQGQLWAEYIPNIRHLDYMAFPRACALSEVLWLDPCRKDYRDFLQRLVFHRKRLEVLGVNAHPQP